MLRSEVDEKEKMKKGRRSVKQNEPEKNLKASVIILKAKHSGLKPIAKTRKVPRRVIANKFWQMVDSYCPNISKGDISVSIYIQLF